MTINRVFLTVILSLSSALTYQQPEAVTAKELVDAVFSDLKPGTKIVPLSRMSSKVMKSATIGFQSAEVVSIEVWLFVRGKKQRIIINVWPQHNSKVIKLVEVPLIGVSLEDLRSMGLMIRSIRSREVECSDGQWLLIKDPKGDSELLADENRRVALFEMYPGFGFNLTLFKDRVFAETPTQIAKCLGKSNKR